MAEVKVEIGAEIKELQSKLNTASKDLKNFEAKGAKNLNKFSKSTKQAGKSLGGLQKGAANGSSAMTAFSRTVQDAPFGLMGVSNNITNLTEQFGYLKKKSGSAGGALKLMLKDLKGFGGITLAISLATSLMLVFGDKILKTKDKTKALREEQEKLTKSLDDYVFGLEAVAQAKIKGQQKAQKELFTLRILKQTIEDTAKSDGVRKSALDELRKIYPSYLKNLTDEKALGGGLKTVYDELTTSILKRARATAASNLIVKNSTDLLTLEDKRKRRGIELDNKRLAFLKKYGKSYEDVVKNQGGDTMGINVFTSELLNDIKSLSDELDTVEGQIQTLELSNIDLEQGIDVTAAIIPKIVIPDEDKGAFLEEIKTKYTEGLGEIQELISADDLEWNTIDWDAYFNLKRLEEQKTSLVGKMQNLAESMQDLKDNALTNAFMGIGSAIGNALGSGASVLEAIGKSLLQSFGGFLTQMGAKMVLYGKLAVAKGKLDLAIAVGGPVAIAAGAAAIKTGILLLAAGAAVGALASGGFGSKGSNAESGGGSSSFSGGSSSSFGSSGGSGGGTVVFEIAGTKLVGVLSNTLKRNRNLGGTISLN